MWSGPQGVPETVMGLTPVVHTNLSAALQEDAYHTLVRWTPDRDRDKLPGPSLCPGLPIVGFQ